MRHQTLASKNIQGLGYLLIQHKAELEGLRIISVNVFLCQRRDPDDPDMDGDYPCMIWTIKGPQPPPPPPKRPPPPPPPTRPPPPPPPSTPPPPPPTPKRRDSFFDDSSNSSAGTDLLPLATAWDPTKVPELSDNKWKRALCKGQNFVNAIREKDADAAQIFKPVLEPPTVQSMFKFPGKPRHVPSSCYCMRGGRS